MSISLYNASGIDSTTLYQSLFKKVDSDGSGGISKTEFETAVSSMASNQNISTQDADSMFNKLDNDGNGAVSSDEMMSALMAAGEERRASMSAQHGNHSKGPDFNKMAQDLLKNLDTNGDGSVDTSELSAALSASQGTGSTDADTLLSKLDANGDGKVDQSELASGLKAMRPPMPPPGGSDRDSDAGSSAVNGTGSSDTDDQSRLFSDLLSSLNSNGTASAAGSGNDLFSDLIKALAPSDQSAAGSDQFAEFLQSLQSASGSSDDQISALFSGLTDYLQNSTQYNQSGSLSYGASSSQSLLSLYG
jgi:Ca2+-binding EF-hand superfamily protein